MANVFIIGGAGNIGFRLSSLLAKKGHTARPLYRKDDQAPSLRQIDAEPVKGDLTELDTGSLASLMAGSEIVVFSAGAGGKGGEEMTNAIDGEGLKTAVAAASQAGITRFLLVSAFPEAARGKGLPASFENYMRVKKMADVALAESELDWVILRPGTLTDEKGTGLVRAGLAIPYGDISRDDVATTLLEIIEQPDVSRIIIELTGGSVPVHEAMQRMAAR